MIYFVQLDSGSIKIGATVNLEQRLGQIEWERGTGAVLLATLKGGREEEKELHAKFAHLRLGRTEQFRPAKELLDFIGKPLLISPNPELVEIQPSASMPTIQRSYRLAPETVERIEQLAKLWGQVRGPLSAACVIDEAMKRVHELETKKQEKRR